LVYSACPEHALQRIRISMMFKFTSKTLVAVEYKKLPLLKKKYIQIENKIEEKGDWIVSKSVKIRDNRKEKERTAVNKYFDRC
jgi:hypothetical protein